MAVGTETYKTLYGDHEVKIFTGIESGKAADKVNDVIKSMADTIEALEDGVPVPILISSVPKAKLRLFPLRGKRQADPWFFRVALHALAFLGTFPGWLSRRIFHGIV